MTDETSRVDGHVSAPAAPSASNSDPLLDRAQLAVYLSISERHARLLIEQRRIDVVVIGRSVRVRTSTAERYIRACTSPATRPVRTDGYGRQTWLASVG